MNGPPKTPRVPMNPQSISGDSLDRLLEALSGLSNEVARLNKKIADLQMDARLSGHSNVESLQEIKRDQKILIDKIDAYTEVLRDRVQTVERNIRRHDSGFRQSSEVDAKQASELAALVIAVEDTRKIAKRALEGQSNMAQTAKDTADETKAQTEKLDKIEGRTKSVAFPAWFMAAFNFILGMIYLATEILKAVHK